MWGWWQGNPAAGRGVGVLEIDGGVVWAGGRGQERCAPGTSGTPAVLGGPVGGAVRRQVGRSKRYFEVFYILVQCVACAFICSVLSEQRCFVLFITVLPTHHTHTHTSQPLSYTSITSTPFFS